MIDVGQAAPDFTLTDAEGRSVSVSDYRGRTVVIYFYPKDDTPGCTKQACSLRDGHAALRERGVVVLGISADNQASHRAFADKYALPFTLLSDPEHTAIRAYGAWGTKNMYGKMFEGIMRYTFVVDAHGIVRKVFKKVKTEDHAAEVLSALDELGL